MSAFNSGDKSEGLEEIQRIWNKMKSKPVTFDLTKLEEEIDNLPIFSLLPTYPGFIKALDSNPNI